MFVYYCVLAWGGAVWSGAMVVLRVCVRLHLCVCVCVCVCVDGWCGAACGCELAVACACGRTNSIIASFMLLACITCVTHVASALKRVSDLLS